MTAWKAEHSSACEPRFQAPVAVRPGSGRHAGQRSISPCGPVEIHRLRRALLQHMGSFEGGDEVVCPVPPRAGGARAPVRAGAPLHHRWVQGAPQSGGERLRRPGDEPEVHQLSRVPQRARRAADRQGGPLADLRPETPLARRGPPRHRTSAAADPGVWLASAAPHCIADGDPGTGGQS